MSDLIDRQVAIDHFRLIVDATNTDSGYNMGFVDGLEFCISHLSTMPSVKPEPLTDAYMEAVWTWLLDYQIKVAELKGRYTPYEVLSWVANDWRKEHEGSHQ